jgi:hypothetical protein
MDQNDNGNITALIFAVDRDNERMMKTPFEVVNSNQRPCQAIRYGWRVLLCRRFISATGWYHGRVSCEAEISDGSAPTDLQSGRSFS